MSNSTPKYSYTASRFEENDIEGFDFSAPAQQYKDFQEILTTTHLRRKKSLFSRISSKFGYIFIILLIASIGWLSLSIFREVRSTTNLGFSLASNFDNQKSTNVIPGKNFTIITDIVAPTDFKLYKTNLEYKSKNLSSDSAFAYSYSTTLNYQNQNSKAGVDVTSFSFDNKLDQNNFAGLVTKDFGGDWKVTDNQFLGTKGAKLSKLQSFQNPTTIYYTTVTSSNYYLIKVYNPVANISEFEKTTNYINELINHIYFN